MLQKTGLGVEVILHMAKSAHTWAQTALDWAVAVIASAALAVSWFNVIDGAEKLITGALVIVLVALRIRSHLRRDRIEREQEKAPPKRG